MPLNIQMICKYATDVCMYVCTYVRGYAFAIAFCFISHSREIVQARRELLTHVSHILLKLLTDVTRTLLILPTRAR